MKLSSLLQEVAVLETAGADIARAEVTDICFDSRKAAPGLLFVAQRGTKVDAHDFIPAVVAAGVTVVVCEAFPAEISPAVTYLKVTDSNLALGQLCSAFFGHPSRQMKLVGVTGTNGKTTIATLLYNLFRALGYRAGLLSTVCNYIDGERVNATHTTPDAYAIQSLMARMVAKGCTHVFMEVSSHSAAQNRIAGLDFDGALFTNLTHDHLDYHKTVDAYLKAKQSFFNALKPEAFALTNADDRNGAVMLQNTRARKYFYSTRTLADFRARLIEMQLEGMQLDFDGREIFVQFLGRFNVSNLLAVYGAALLLGEPREEVLRLLTTLRPVSGRLEYLRSPAGFVCLVDYAHTPDALHNVLDTLSQLKAPRIITVAGCGGNRDRTKRPEMGAEVARSSDIAILTSDNPRFEEPQDILNEMYAGVPDSQRKKVLCILDRREAIRTAIKMADKGDLVLVAGKGHEDYQEIRGVKHHFDDKEVIAEAFRDFCQS